MRVLLMDVNCKYSSTGKIVYDMYTQLNSEGNVAGIAYGRGPIVEGDNIIRFSPQWEVYLHGLLTRLTGLTGCFSYVATRRLIRFIKKFKPDVVHLNDMHGYFVNINQLVRYLKRNNIYTVWTFHCEFMYTGKCGHAYNCEMWKKECRDCPQLREYPKSLLFDFTNRMFLQKRNLFCDWKRLQIVTPSEWLRNRVKSSFLKNRNVEVVFNGLDETVFYPRNYTQDFRKRFAKDDNKIVLSVAPNLMSESKGGKYVKKVAEDLRDDAVFLLVGIEDINESLPSNAVNLGVIKDADYLAQLYSIADVFLLCSKRETFSMTTAEALCCGTPVVGFEAGAPETIALKNCSIFVPQGDTNELEKALRCVLNGAIGLQRSEIATHAKREYTKQRMYQNYLEIYEKQEFL